ncbi:hypothetical protein TTHERM_000532539 (macronuclear) [Tetrahymena thermophila SB210]|uniref:Kinase domain protein n=1 Tax=Tetrahymena thermophila (strain SB210) TaxID=312017 RepID=W7WYH8_TETTS|nr:hypothetical protein TTHERM_000532539 [Tetrahymena thermophila SB210]EWS71920.1 hypothetical protein TTHERM_000532539 [Tetrahymena thermophila SB210]|eukprot:XP_012655549.1 hypothetical protein TTHERM_000532539 [Tetrahymena thermophila SB210]
MGQKPDKQQPQPSIHDNSQNQITEKYDCLKEKLIQVKQQIHNAQNQDSLFISKWGFMLDYNFGIQLGQLISNQVQLVNLKLDFSINNLQQEGVRALFENFKNLNQLQMLIINLQENKLLDEGAAGIAKGISLCKNLEHLKLDLGFNKISGEDNIFKPLGNLQNLTFLDLSFEKNTISTKGLKDMASDLSSLFNLMILKLNFKNNQFSCIDGFDTISQLKSLQQLEISFQSNQITVVSLNKWFSDIKNGFNQLISLDLDFQGNNFKDILTEQFQLSGLAQIKSLNRLGLSIYHNNLNICQEISKLNNIHRLSLTNIKDSLDQNNLFRILSKMVNLRVFEIVLLGNWEHQIFQNFKDILKAKRLVVIKKYQI